MQVNKTSNSATSTTLTIELNATDLEPIKQTTVERLGKDLKLPGFRPGKAPLSLQEKQLDPALLQNEVLETAMNNFYGQAITQQNLRPVNRPEVSIKKFVPFTQLEFTATVEVVGEIKLPDYKKLKKTRPTVKVTTKDIEEVLATIAERMAKRQDVDRAAKKGDEVWIDFKGTDSQGKPVAGAEGKNYPLILGSDSFIPGFEANLIGGKAGEGKTFTLTFPKDYGVKALANKKVTFEVNISKVQAISQPKIDDALAAQAGPFKNLDQLKADIKTELTREREQKAQRDLEQQVIEAVTKQTKVTIPTILIDEQVEAMVREQRQNLTYRGQTWEEFLKQEGKTDDAYRQEVLRPQAEQRVKAGLMLSQVAEQEKIDVTASELDQRLAALRAEYKDERMQAELDKPENRREIAMRLLTEKTIAKLVA